MRIIAGKLRGRKLVSFSAKHIRPTTDRVKESIFNKFQAEIPEARVLDLFSGTGNLAIESYSRGAAFVEAVERNPKSLKIIKHNLEELGISGEVQVVGSDVMKYLQNYSGESFDIILIDPPFTQALSHSVLEQLGSSKVLKSGTQIMVESARAERVDESYSGLKLLDQKSFGDKKVTFFEGETI